MHNFKNFTICMKKKSFDSQMIVALNLELKFQCKAKGLFKFHYNLKQIRNFYHVHYIIRNLYNFQMFLSSLSKDKLQILYIIKYIFTTVVLPEPTTNMNI